MIFPPYGLFDPSHIAYRPLEVLAGRLEIDGRELAPVDPAEVHRVVRRMLEAEQVAAFAVSGYASHVNPSHELQVKAIIQEFASVSVTCAHEVSDKPNYRVRSVTAALNASIIPCLESFWTRSMPPFAARHPLPADGGQERRQLDELVPGARPPDRDRPFRSGGERGGASYLAGLTDAMVVDMGGTTTDTAISAAAGCACAARGLGRRMADARRRPRSETVGLGGDSLIVRNKEASFRSVRFASPPCRGRSRTVGTRPGRSIG